MRLLRANVREIEGYEKVGAHFQCDLCGNKALDGYIAYPENAEELYMLKTNIDSFQTACVQPSAFFCKDCVWSWDFSQRPAVKREDYNIATTEVEKFLKTRLERTEFRKIIENEVKQK